MHILLAPDSFKESLSAKQVAEDLKKGFQEALPDATFDLLPIGDGLLILANTYSAALVSRFKPPPSALYKSARFSKRVS